MANELVKKGKLGIDGLKLLYRSDLIPQHSGPLFQTTDGDDVFMGDSVAFYVGGEHLPHNGIVVSTTNGLRINCFNTILYRWEYYAVEGKTDGWSMDY